MSIDTGAGGTRWRLRGAQAVAPRRPSHGGSRQRHVTTAHDAEHRRLGRRRRGWRWRGRSVRRAYAAATPRQRKATVAGGGTNNTKQRWRSVVADSDVDGGEAAAHATGRHTCEQGRAATTGGKEVGIRVG